MTTREYGIQAIKDEAEALLDLIPKMDENFDLAVDLILRCKGKVIVTGVGKSGHIGAKIAATLASTGTPSFFINPLDVFHGDLGVMTHDDVVIAISNSGQTDELLRFIPMVLHMEIPIIGMSGNPSSLLAKYSTYHLYVGVKKEACPLNLAPTSSTTAALAMGDALAIALMQKRDFRPQDFAHFHPGGELGKRLLTTAQDVMRSDNLPVFPPDTHLGKAIMMVSEGKLGLGVAEVDGHIVGLITDGDIRRAIALESRVLQPQRERYHDPHAKDRHAPNQDYRDTTYHADLQDPLRARCQRRQSVAGCRRPLFMHDLSRPRPNKQINENN